MIARVLGMTLLAPALLLGGPAQAQAPAGGSAPPMWKIDTSHSELTFRIRHLISRVSGTFGEWGGTIVADPAKLGEGRVDVSIATASIDTNQQRRDNHLRSADFFDAEAHPAITFRSRSVQLEGDRMRIHGDLTMRGITKPVMLEGSFLGVTRDGSGKERMGFEATTTIDRQDFGIRWNNLVEGGGAVLGDDVTIAITVAAVRQ